MENNIYINVLRDIATAIRQKRRIYTSTSTRGNIQIKVKDFATQIQAINTRSRLTKPASDTLKIGVLSVISYTASANAAAGQTYQNLIDIFHNIENTTATMASKTYCPLETVAREIIETIPGNSTYIKQGDTLIFTKH